MKQPAQFTRMRNTRFFALLAIAAFGFLMSASGAHAGCAFTTKPAGTPPALEGVPAPAPTAAATTAAAANDDDWREPASIVGLWHVVYEANYSTPPFPTAPFKFNESYKMWHHDGTEFENAFLPPSGNNICYGVWKEVGKGGVKLHHIGLMFNASGEVSNTFTVDEVECLAPDGKSYTGTFDFKLFDATDVLGTGTPIAEVKGTQKATRITVD
jgi:hypothetical protein